MDFVDKLARLNKTENTLIRVAHDAKKECIYVCLAENYSASTNIMTNASEFCKQTNPDKYSAFLIFCNANK